MTRRFAALAAMLLASAAVAQEPAKTPLAEPSLSADGRLIAFVSGGDIWEVAATGGVAHLLVTHNATEGRPLYSPDGSRLAFTSTRGGNANVYVLDLARGTTTRLTYAEADEELDAWSADGKWLYFANGTTDVGYESDLFRVSTDGGTPMQVSREAYLSESQGAPSPDGTRLVLAARGTAAWQWWRNGSSHLDQTELWTRPVDGDAYRPLLVNAARNAWPRWSADGASIVYMSDQGGTENLWRIGADGGAAQPLTRFTDGRVLYPSLAADGSIVFERDFGVWRRDPATGVVAAVPITLRGAAAGPGKRHIPLRSWDRMALSPDGQKIALVGHGEIFAVSVKDGGVAQRITTSVGMESGPVWSPDSKRLLYVTERGLRHVVAETDVATGKERDLTAPGGLVTGVAYAPDGASVSYIRDDRELHRLTMPRGKAAGTDTILFTGAINFGGEGAAPAWSPDGKWIAFPVIDRRSFTNVWLVPSAGGTARPISVLGNGNLGRITWDPQGKFVLFDTSQRTEDSRIVRVDLERHVPRYREDVFRDLFKPGETPPEDTPAAPAKQKPLPARKPPAAPQPGVTIAWDGLRERATLLPIGLSTDTPVISADGKTLVFRAVTAGQENLYSYSLDELADDPPVAQQISRSDKPKGDFALSADGKTLVYLDGGTPVATPLESPKPKPIAVEAAMDVDFDAEKQVVFDEAWSLLDRRFYDPKFHGQDWAALRTRFQPYVAGARTPDELRRTLRLMIGELNASHTGLGGPRRGPDAPPRDRVGDLGLRFDRAAYEGGRGLVVREVLALGPAGVEQVRPGDRLVAVDGHAIAAHDNLDALLENQVGRRVVLAFDRGGTRREVVVQPVSVETAGGIAYREWVASRRAYVERVSGGRLGYVHMADMGAESLQQLYLDLDAQNQARAGVVVDIRNNGGGFVNGYALDVFSRRNFLTMTPRGMFPIPGRQTLGQRALGLPTVLVTNEASLSDAEDFTEGYRTLGLGKIVGQPTSGWIIYTSQETLIDGSAVRLPSIRVEDDRGQTMEMNPRPVDVTVARPLGETLTGRDAQLDAAVATLLAGLGAGAKPQ